MGYRSEVYILINNTATNDLLNHCIKAKRAYSLLFEDTAPKKMKGGHLLWQLDYVKWYPSYEDVKETMEFLVSLQEQGRSEEFSFARLGEEYGDWETYGESEEVYFMPRHSTEVYCSEEGVIND